MKAIQRLPETILPYPAKLATQLSMLGPIGSLFEGFKCLASKVTKALMGTIEDMLVGAVQNMLNVPVCAVEEFVGGVVNKVANLIDSAVSPLVNPKVDLVVVRENTEGEYASVGGNFKPDTEDEVAIQTSIFTRKGTERIIRYAFEVANSRSKTPRL